MFGTAPSSINVVMQGLTIRNGKLAGDGGGIRVVDADLVVRDCVISANQAGFGGGIANVSSSASGIITLVRTTVARNVSGVSGGGVSHAAPGSVLTVRDSVVRRNYANGHGGGIFAATANLTNCTVNGNSAGSFSGGGITATETTLIGSTVSGNYSAHTGGGIRATTATLTRSTVVGNITGIYGGGIYADTTTLTNSVLTGNNAGDSGGGLRADAATLTNCTIEANAADVAGGGIYSALSMTLTRSTVSGNITGGSGGGIYSTGAATLTNGTLSGNTAAENGGGLWANAAELLNCTVVENVARFFGGGVHHSPGSAFNLRNTLVALNLVGHVGSGPDLFGDFTSEGHNLVGDGSSADRVHARSERRPGGRQCKPHRPETRHSGEQRRQD